MESPPDAEPVTAASKLVAVAKKTKGPSPIPKTQSRTTANTGSEAIRAPNQLTSYTPSDCDCKESDSDRKEIVILSILAIR